MDDINFRFDTPHAHKKKENKKNSIKGDEELTNFLEKIIIKIKHVTTKKKKNDGQESPTFVN